MVADQMVVAGSTEVLSMEHWVQLKSKIKSRLFGEALPTQPLPTLFLKSTFLRNVLKKYPFLDARRLFVFGWSYGGFASALMVERAPEAFFKCAISGAPVANFLFYGNSVHFLLRIEICLSTVGNHQHLQMRRTPRDSWETLAKQLMMQATSQPM
ncbi:hypothetical protein ANCDUO_03286 [Ancylostoma duodenale]|uniref:Peptidase S9 prolyl oligopeptidase catalytic domain-containing protein n=1 Tax=Ancylostoma duodenale TaxID=51022 RepID=A0A0C2GY13_9BILA|nr:hypothetical protein ANCDUO_03286 [Ancylostoma duodenale]